MAIAGLLLCLLSGVASAAPRTIAPEGSGAGEVVGARSVAVHQGSGDVYVADLSNFRVLKFGAAGEFLLGFGLGVRDGSTPQLQTCGPEAVPPTVRCFSRNSSGIAVAGKISPQSVAVDQASGSVYVSDVGARRITKFSAGGEFLFMVGKGVNQGGGAPAGPGNICTAQHLANGDICGLGESGNGPNEFSAPSSLAVDSTGMVWVGDTSRLQSFDLHGIPGTEIALPGAGIIWSLAVDSAGDFFVKSNTHDEVRKLEGGTGALLGSLAVGLNSRTIALDGADNLYVGHCVSDFAGCGGNPYRFLIFNQAGEQVSQFGLGEVIGIPGGSIPTVGGNGIAVENDTRTMYVAGAGGNIVQAFDIPDPGPLISDQRAKDLVPDSATLVAELNPEGDETTYHFEYGISPAYGQASVAQMLPSAGFEAESVSTTLSGLVPNMTYHFRLVATNHCRPAEPAVVCKSEGPDGTFKTPMVVGIESQWASDVSATGAELHASLNPYGEEATWWVEYGSEPCSLGGCTSSVEFALEESSSAVTRRAALVGLEPAGTYYYRFAARGERNSVTYTAHGIDQILRTQRGGLGLNLPNRRAWELVTPARKHGALLRPPSEGLVQAAVGGDGLAYLTRGSVEPDPSGSRSPEEGTTLARRAADGRWGSKDLRPPSAKPHPMVIGWGREYPLFSPGLEVGLLEPRDVALIASTGHERAPFLWNSTAPSPYRPLLPAPNDVSACTPPYGHDDGFEDYIPLSAVRVVGASESLEHVALRSAVPLACGAASGSLYLWSDGSLEPLSVTPVDQGGQQVTAQLGSSPSSVRNAISTTGERVYWTIESGANAGLFVRDMERKETLRLDLVQPGGWGLGSVSPTFQGADRAGRVAIFTDTRQLTEDAGEVGRDLYRCELEIQGGELQCSLTNLTGPALTAGKGAQVLGLVAGMSDDASHAYFVGRGVLDQVVNGYGDSAVSGKPNLYVWQEGEGIRFIATLGEADQPNWGVGGVGLQAARQSAAASPGGRYLAFMSSRSLTGFDNRDAVGAEPAQQVFQYDAVSERLLCVSCNPSGARPRALRPGQDGLGQEFDPQEIWSDVPVAALLPEATRLQRGGASLYRPRAVHDNGRVFFNAADSLVPADSNGNGDVYQYEPLGSGSCTEISSGAGVERVEGGCVALISSGTAEGTAAFVDASAGGDDAFFFSPGRLSVLDEDNVADIYDARVDGVTATMTPRVECQGEACQPPPFRPETSTPASAAFAGPGNFRPKAAPRRCPKGKRLVKRVGRMRCVAFERRKVKRSGRKARHAKRNGRAGR